MHRVDDEGIIRYRLRAHHLDRDYAMDTLKAVVGACGMQNTPPGVWEQAVFHRIANARAADLRDALTEGKRLVQAWSFRGAPVVFPAGESAVFLTVLIPQGKEPWIYTDGVSHALQVVQMSFDDLLARVLNATAYLDDHTVQTKQTLDTVLADIVMSSLPEAKRKAWQSDSMYAPGRQTTGEAIVSFMLRPCAFKGRVVFGKRQSNSPSFASYQRWMGGALPADGEAEKKLVRKFLHCYAPATPEMLAAWLGCSQAQALRLWKGVEQEVEAVLVDGKARYVLASDLEALCAPEAAQREYALLSAHDPYVDIRDRAVLVADKRHRLEVWKTVGNPGVVLQNGRIIGTWRSRKQGTRQQIAMTLWGKADSAAKAALGEHAERFAAFGGAALAHCQITGEA